MSIKITDNIVVGEKLLLLSGPCSAESYDICARTAENLKKLCQEVDVNYVFKASFDKANRSSVDSFRGPGLDEGLELLAKIKKEFDLPIVTDIHESGQAKAIAEVADIIQIPAFLCRQTDLLVAVGETDKVINIKKGQFVAPEDMINAINKVKSTGNDKIMLCERGTTFGYHNFVVDMRSFPIMKAMGVPVVFDATHSVQRPGGLGNCSGGDREYVAPLARAAAGAGIDALFMEVHPNPDEAKCDGPNSLDFQGAADVLKSVKAIYELTK